MSALIYTLLRRVLRRPPPQQEPRSAPSGSALRLGAYAGLDALASVSGNRARFKVTDPLAQAGSSGISRPAASIGTRLRPAASGQIAPDLGAWEKVLRATVPEDVQRHSVSPDIIFKRA